MAVLVKLVNGEGLKVVGDVVSVAREIANSDKLLVKMTTEDGDVFVNPAAVATIADEPVYGRAAF